MLVKNVNYNLLLYHNIVIYNDGKYYKMETKTNERRYEFES
jgi:hypothetical protein